MSLLPQRSLIGPWARVRERVGRLYAGLAYAASLVLLFIAAMLTGTHAREAFIYIFLPGVLLAALSPFIWRGSRSAMLLAFMVSIVVQLMILDSDSVYWRLVLPVPFLFGALTVAGMLATARPESDALAPGVTAEVFAALVYFTGVLGVFMAPFNHSRLFGWPGLALYTALVGGAAGILSALIWRGSIAAMMTAFGLSLLHWFVLGSIDPALWRNVPNIAAAAVSGLLAVASLVTARRGRPSAPSRPSRS
jgi:hypothetical protein